MARVAEDARFDEGKTAAVFGDVHGASSITLSVAASLTWTVTEERGLIWPGLAGTVTAVFATPGSELSSGTPVAEVNGFTVIALHTAEPLYRIITSNVIGPDRDAVEGYLRFVLGEPELSFGRLVNEYLKQVGSPIMDGQFRPEYVVWLPSPTMSVGRVEGLTAGAAGPAASTAVIYPPQTIELPQLTSSDGTGPIEVGLSSPLDIVIDLGDAVNLPGALAANGTIDLAAGTDLSPLLDLSSPLDVSVTISRPGDYLVVPSGAVVIDRDSCLALASSPSGDVVLVTVEAIWTSDGVVYFDREDVPSLEGQQVLLNPLESEVSCPS